MSVKTYHRLYGDKRILLSVGVIVIALVAILGAPAIKRQLNAWKLLPEPERLTELYFTHSNSLPATYTAGQAQTVSFTVHNLEYRPTSYHYSVEQTNGNAKTVLATGSFTLQQNGFARPNVPVVLTDMSDSTVTVDLSPVNETIAYVIKEQSS